MEAVRRIYFKVMKKLTSSFARLIGPIHAPFTHKPFTYESVIELENNLEIGDILLTRTHGEMTTLVIPGHWKHAIVYAGSGMVVEAVGNGVRLNHLANVVMKTDNIVALRKKGGITASKKYELTLWLEEQIGIPYDYEMNTEGDDAFYCSELAAKAMDLVAEMQYFKLKSRVGFMTITPDDIYNSQERMEIIWERRSK